VSSRKARTLIALTWAAAVAAGFLTWWSPPFRSFMNMEQWAIGALTGWIAHAAWLARRKRV
jgi:hypothetical protein